MISFVHWTRVLRAVVAVTIDAPYFWFTIALSAECWALSRRVKVMADGWTQPHSRGRRGNNHAIHFCLLPLTEKIWWASLYPSISFFLLWILDSLFFSFLFLLMIFLSLLLVIYIYILTSIAVCAPRVAHGTLDCRAGSGDGEWRHLREQNPAEFSSKLGEVSPSIFFDFCFLLHLFEQDEVYFEMHGLFGCWGMNKIPKRKRKSKTYVDKLWFFVWISRFLLWICFGSWRSGEFFRMSGHLRYYTSLSAGIKLSELFFFGAGSLIKVAFTSPGEVEVVLLEIYVCMHIWYRDEFLKMYARSSLKNFRKEPVAMVFLENLVCWHQLWVIA